jgi:hypothetical protein
MALVWSSGPKSDNPAKAKVAVFRLSAIALAHDPRIALTLPADRYGAACRCQPVRRLVGRLTLRSYSSRRSVSSWRRQPSAARNSQNVQPLVWE